MSGLCRNVTRIHQMDLVVASHKSIYGPELCVKNNDSSRSTTNLLITFKTE